MVTSAIMASKTPGRTDNDLAAHFGTRADETVRRSAGDKDHVAGAQFQQLSVEAKVVVSFADDERLVIRWMSVVASARLGRLYGLADGIRIPVFACGRLERHAHPTELKRLAFSRLEARWLLWVEHVGLRVIWTMLHFCCGANDATEVPLDA
jgi:hypothetical protein